MADAVNSNLVSESVVDAEVVEAAASAPAEPVETAAPAASPIPAVAKAPRPAGTYRNVTTMVAISFSLTFVGASLALLTGALPADAAALDLPVDTGVVLLMVPLCALVLAMLAEVLRTAMRGLPRLRPSRPAAILGTAHPGAPAEWRAGRREG